MLEEAERTRKARAISERALVSVVRQYGEVPEFVVLGGLVPEVLCTQAPVEHAGTSDVDVQVDLEIAHGSTNAARLERALLAAGFQPDDERVWRWMTSEFGTRSVVKFELLADRPTAPSGTSLTFDDCRQLGAANLRGTGFAARDRVLRTLSNDGDGAVQVYMAGLAGFLLAKVAAARGRRKAKDWYDIAFVLLHNDAGGPELAAQQVIRLFPEVLNGEMWSALCDLRANFATPDAQGAAAYVRGVGADDMDEPTLAARAEAAVQMFCRGLGMD